MNIKLLNITKIRDQDIIYGVFYCKYKEFKKTKYGDNYINIGLSDSSGHLDSKVWENSEYYSSKFSEGDIVAVKGTPGLYRDKIELKISHITKCDPLKYKRYGFNSSMVISRIDFNSKILWKEVTSYFKKTGNRLELIKRMYYDYKKSIILFPSNIKGCSQVEGSYINDISKALKILDILLNRISDKKLIDSELIYSLVYFRKFHLITGYKKDVLYRVNDEALDRGLSSVFYDVFKQYGKLIDKKLFFSMEKCIFDADSDDFSKEKTMIEEVFSLIDHAN